MFATGSGKRDAETSSTTIGGHASTPPILLLYLSIEADSSVPAGAAVPEDIEWPWEQDAASSLVLLPFSLA